jgi:hypothetical protein
VTLRHEEPPEESRRAAEQGVRDLIERGAASSPALRRAAPDRLDLASPHRTYVLALDDLRGGGGLDAAQPLAWRYLAEQGGEVLAAVETLEEQDGRHVLSQVSYGPFVAGTVEALRAAARFSADADANVRLLHIPALYVMAVWLLRADGSSALIPIAPTPTGIEANRVYPADDLLRILAERAAASPAIGPADGLGT